jgi:hypothetical protein
MCDDSLDDPAQTGRRGRAHDGWVCSSDVTEAIPPSALVVSLDNGFGPSSLYEVELAANGLDRLVRSIRSTSGQLLSITDVAQVPNGPLYGISFTDLYQIDKQTAVATLVGPLGVSTANALASTATGVLYASTADGELLRRTSGGWLTVGPIGFSSSGDLAFSPSGELYSSVTSLFGNDQLAKIDGVTGRGTIISPAGGLGFVRVWGLAFSNGSMYGLAGSSSGGVLIRIDAASGRATALRDLGFVPAGAASRIP